MPIIVNRSTYLWLQSLNILQSQPYAQRMEILYDDQIYLQNGYLVAQLLKKVLSKQASQLLYKVRKIATLMSFQNWEIIRKVLQQDGYDIYGINWQQQINHSQIANMLEYLCEKYAPQQILKKRYKNKKKQLFFDLHGFDAKKNYYQAQNSLQFMCLLLCFSFEISAGQALGLLIQDCKYMKRLIKNGSKMNQFDKVKRLYTQFMDHIQLFSSSIIHDERQHLSYFLQGLSEGVMSQSQQISQLCCQMFNKLNQPEWLYSKGIMKMFLSPHKSTFSVLLSLLHPNYKTHLNQDLCNKFKSRKDFLEFCTKMLRFLPTHLQRTEIINALRIDYYVEQVLLTFDIDSQQPLINRILARQALMIALVNFQSKISYANISKCSQIGFSYELNSQKSYEQQFHLIANLFTIIENQLMKQSAQVEPFFKNAMKFQSSPFPQIRQFTLANIIQIYKKLNKLFPLGCFLATYIPNQIGQLTDYAVLQLVSLDMSILKDQINKTLEICTDYYYYQVHCRCFIEIIKNLSSKRQSINWANSNISKILGQWPIIQKQQQQKINQLANIKPKPMKQTHKFSYVGVKRKQMLHSNHYENYYRLLLLLTELEDKKFLLGYYQKIQKYLQSVKNINSKNKCLLFMKNLLKRIKIKHENARQVQDIIPNYSAYSRSTQRNQNKIKTQTQQQSYPQQEESSQVSLSKTMQNSSEAFNNQNEFLTENMQLDFERNLKQKKDKENLKQQRQTILLPFTEEQRLINKYQYPFYDEANLQQYQLIYIKMLMEKHEDIIQKCLNIYMENPGISLQQFLTKIQCNKIIESQKMAFSWQKCKVYYESQPRQLIKNMLIQLGFACFAFKKSKRIAVTSLQSFFQFLQKSFSQKKDHQFNKKNDKKSIQRAQESYQIGKSMKFQFQLSNKISSLDMLKEPKQIPIDENQFTIKNNSFCSQSFFICFAVLSDIYSEATGSPLMQPITKIINQMILPKKKQKNIKDQELQQLQKIVERQQLARSMSMNESQSYTNNGSTYLSKKQRKPNEIQLNKSYLVAQSQNFEKLKNQNNKLRQKLMKRRQMLQQDMKKKYSTQNVSKINDEKKEEDQ